MPEQRQDIQEQQQAALTPTEAAVRPERRVLAGVGVAPGIAMGPAYVFVREAPPVQQRRLADGEVTTELGRFEKAVERAEQDLQKIIAITHEKLGEESAEIFEAQRLMLRDQALFEAVQERIRGKQHNASFAVQEVMRAHRRRLETSESEYLRERASDLTDVEHRVVRHLRRGKLLSAITPGAIVVAERLTAADLILFSRRDMRGCAIVRGGATSHVAIMARALGMPTVIGVEGLTEAVETGDRLILDGREGRVVVHPTPEDEARCQSRRARYRRLREEHQHLAALPPETRDGRRVTLRANVEFSQEIGLLKRYGADGVGLFRTEMLLLMRGEASLAEEFKFQSYKGVVEAVSPALTTLRLLDLGGDKLLPLGSREANPFLGWRGIRVLLDKPEVLRSQLRAVLRASAHGPVRMLLPMVTQLDEIHRFREHLSAVEAQLADEGIAFDDAIPLGIMVEVPAVALQAERFAREVDFFSIGTNDLTQYVLAVDRGNERVAGYFNEFHPAVLSFMQHVVKEAHAQGIPVSLCGEMAARPQAVPLLVGLGLDELSASPTYLPEVKRVLRAIRCCEAEALVEQALAASDAAAVRDLVRRWMDEHIGAPEDAS